MATVRHVRLGDNSVYLVEDAGEAVLVDTGPDFKGAREALEKGLGKRRPGLVLATHGHLDHAGLGRWWQEHHDVPVVAGADDERLCRQPQLSDPFELACLAGWVHRSGAPAEVAQEVVHGLEARRAWARAAAEPGDYPSIGRDRRWPTGLRFEHFEPMRPVAGEVNVGGVVRALPMPGHTPGNVVAVHEGEGWLFSGDQLLPEITPVPAVQVKGSPDEGDWRLRSLPEFVRGLERLASQSFSRCFPGHGEPFDNVGDVIRANLAQIEQRTARVAEALGCLGRATIYRLCEELYPRAVRRRFWQIASTVQGHLDLLDEQGRARMVAGGEWEG